MCLSMPESHHRFVFSGGLQWSMNLSMARVGPRGMCPKKRDSCFRASDLGAPSMAIFQIAAANPERSAPAWQWIRTGLGAVRKISNRALISLSEGARPESNSRS